MMTNLKIQLTVNGQSATADLLGTAAAREFYALLPLTLTLSDYANTEKIAYLPKRLNVAGAADGYTPATRDIAYYAPWGNIAIFYKGFDYSDGLIKLGTIDGDLSALMSEHPAIVRIEPIGP